MVEGLSLVYDRYGDEIDRGVLLRKLQKVGNPGVVVGRARTYADIRSIKVSPALAAVVIDIYNKGRTARTVEPWH